MSDNVDLKFTGNSTDAQKAVAELERRFDALEAKIKRTKSTSRDLAKTATGDTQSWANSLDNVAAKYATIAAGAGAIKRILDGIGQANVEASAKLDAFREKFNEAAVKFNVQVGVDGGVAREQQDKIVKQLEKTPVVELPAAIDVGRIVAGSGVRQEDVDSGAGAGAIFDTMAAMGTMGRDIADPADIVRPFSQFAKGLGDADWGADDIKRVGGKLADLFTVSDVTLGDLSFLARKAGTLQQFGMDETSQLALFSQQTDVLGSEKAATGIAGFISRTGSAGAVEERRKALADYLQLQPEDVAMTKGGKTLEDVRPLMKERLDKLTPEKQNEFMTRMYGEESAPSAQLIFSEEGWTKYQQYKQEAATPDKFNIALSAFQQSRYAENARAKLQEANALRTQLEETSQTWGEARQDNAAWMAQQRAEIAKQSSGPVATIKRGVIGAMDWATRGAGAVAEKLGFMPDDLPPVVDINRIGKMQMKSVQRQLKQAEAEGKLDHVVRPEQQPVPGPKRELDKGIPKDAALLNLNQPAVIKRLEPEAAPISINPTDLRSRRDRLNSAEATKRRREMFIPSLDTTAIQRRELEPYRSQDHHNSELGRRSDTKRPDSQPRRLSEFAAVSQAVTVTRTNEPVQRPPTGPTETTSPDLAWILQQSHQVLLTIAANLPKSTSRPTRVVNPEGSQRS